MFQRLLTTSSLLTLAVLAALVFSTPASAAPYPPSNPPAVSVSAYDPCAGASNIIGGNGFQPGETVRIVLDGRIVGETVVGADGAFQLTVTVPQDTRGSAEVLVVGQTSGLTASTVLSVSCVLAQSGSQLGADGGAEGDSGASRELAAVNGGAGGGSLASTGAAVGGIVVGAVVLLGAGAALTVAGRRRRGSAAAG